MKNSKLIRIAAIFGLVLLGNAGLTGSVAAYGYDSYYSSGYGSSYGGSYSGYNTALIYMGSSQYQAYYPYYAPATPSYVNPYSYNYGGYAPVYGGVSMVMPNQGCNGHMGFLYDPYSRSTVYTCGQ